MGLWDVLVETWREASEEVERKNREQNRLRAGNVIRVDLGYFDHYGVYVGGYEVVHFTDKLVQKTSLTSFAKPKKNSFFFDCPILVNAISDNFLISSTRFPVFPPLIREEFSLLSFLRGQSDKVDIMGFNKKAIQTISLEDSCARAISMIGMSSYDLIENNCEHFAVWCRTGKPISTQTFGSVSDALSTYSSSRLTSSLSSGGFNAINIGRMISKIYCSFFEDELGMKRIRTVDVDSAIDG